MRRLVFALLTLVQACNCDDPLARQYPVMKVSPQDDVHLTNVPVAQDTKITFTVLNDHLVDLHRLKVELVSADSDPAFTLDDNYADRVLAGTSTEVTLNVRPRTVAKIKAKLIFTSEKVAVPRRVEIPIVVEAVDAGLPDICVTPESLTFTGVGRNDVGRASLDVKNCGTADLLLDCVYLVPAGADEELLTADGCPTRDPEDQPFRISTRVANGFAVQPSEVAALTTSFAPIDTDLHNAELVILSNDPDEPALRVPMSGQGSECPTAVIEFLHPEDQYEPFDLIGLDGHNSMQADGTVGGAWTYEWTLTVRPIGSTAVLSSNTDSNTELPVDLAGDYSVSLHVRDSDGIRSCVPATVDIPVIPTEDLVVQLVWDHPDADLDLHTLREGGTVFTHEGDCYFSNRQPEGAPWSLNPDENPNLDHDDDEGYGPENMNIKHPAPGSRWTLAVHYWNKQTDVDARTTATLRVFAYGQQVIELTRVFEDDQQLWRAVEIVWPNDDTSPPALSQIGTVEPFARPF